MKYKVFFFLSIIFIISCSEETKVPLTGKELYSKNCVACHGADGTKGLANAADLSISKLSIGEQMHIVTNGKNTMAPFKLSLNEAQIDSVVKYIQQLKK